MQFVRKFPLATAVWDDDLTRNDNYVMLFRQVTSWIDHLLFLFKDPATSHGTQKCHFEVLKL